MRTLTPGRVLFWTAVILWTVAAAYMVTGNLADLASDASSAITRPVAAAGMGR